MQLNLPDPQNTRVKTATFVKSSIKTGDCPPDRYPDFAVIGRSNVGKSSLINMLTGRRDLALVSKSPGKTRCINHFLINDAWYLVDLPGYGYARTSKDQRHEFDVFTKLYFLQRSSLALVMLLVDSSIPPQRIDLLYAAWLADRNLPFALVFTKADKRKKGGSKCAENMLAFKRALLERHGFELLPPSVVTSAESDVGKGELLRLVGQLRELWVADPARASQRRGAGAGAAGGRLRAEGAQAGGGGGGAAGGGELPPSEWAMPR